jgi:site-specific recombinase XerD
MDSQTNPRLHALSELSATSLDQVNRYLTALEARNYAQTTLAAIVSIIKKPLCFLPETSRQRIRQDLARVTADDLDVYIQAARQQELAPSTINYTLSTLKGFFAFLCETGEMPRQPIIKRRHSLFVPESLPKPMAEADLITFFKVIDSIRDRLLFLLMLRCGLRVSEACGITWRNVDLDNGTVVPTENSIRPHVGS